MIVFFACFLILFCILFIYANRNNTELVKEINHLKYRMGEISSRMGYDIGYRNGQIEEINTKIKGLENFLKIEVVTIPAVCEKREYKRVK